ncbi:HAD family hydrolase [Streptomyces sp. NPDC093970]|uniref:HAD family hydrolase n=1 Tax=Streptomyces sp. NPDC093970 TaxID=3155076 RepID=UPI00341E717C
MTDAFGDVEEARKLIERSRYVLFDFDGPVCRLFPEERPSAPLAEQLRRTAEKFEVADLLTGTARETTDPHVVLRAVHGAGHREGVIAVVAAMEEELTAGEMAAAALAVPTEHSVEFVEQLHARGRRLAIVTNNSAKAAWTYLSRHGLLPLFGSVEGRTADPGLMKPDPDVLRRALRALGSVGSGDAVMIGDSESDVLAARSAGVGFIGYGRNDAKVQRLRKVDALIVVRGYSALLRGM